MCLSMWGPESSWQKYLQEAYRVLRHGGRFHIVESAKAWSEGDENKQIEEGKEGELLRVELEKVFDVVLRISDNDSKFCYFYCMKC